MNIWFFVFGAGVLIVGALGVFFTVLPGLVPRAQDPNPRLRALSRGYARLAAANCSDDEGYRIGKVRPNDEGFEQLYSLLAKLDPTVPPLQRTKSAETRETTEILLESDATWHFGDRSIPMVQLVMVCPANQERILVSKLDALATDIENSRVIFWSRMGLVFTFLALLISLLYSAGSHSQAQQFQDRLTQLELMVNEMGTAHRDSIGGERPP